MALTISECLERGPATSKEIQALTGLGQSAVARHLRNMGESVISLKKGRACRYVMTRNAFGGDDRLPLVVVNSHGNIDVIAFVRPLAHGGFFVQEATGMPHLLLGESEDGLYDDLPYFLSDLAPQGFIGRKIAAEMSAHSDSFPSDPINWNTNHIGRYLLSNGDDLPGNFKFGIQGVLRIRQKPTSITRDDYARLANEVMDGVVGGSSAGGEQPKFTAFCSERSAHVIVKFSPRGDNEIARRWRDVLITEHHATESLHLVNLPAAETELVEKDGRLFLESIRFDRSGEYGRQSMVSLQSIDAEFVGSGGSWPQVIEGLFSQKLISHFNYYNAKFLWAFGRLINNTDMHLGNISFGIESNVFRLLPIYDMCSMGFSPKTGGEVAAFNFSIPSISAARLDDDRVARSVDLARIFWDKVASDERISDEFKAFLAKGNPVDNYENAD